jgi:pyridoxine/pyridoxamine 5'-phosphate oxidase
MDIADMRVDYRRGRLRREDLKSDPIEQFQLWLEEACQAGVIEPTAMSLATVGVDGRPLVRTVLLKGLDQRGFVFFTNLEEWERLKHKFGTGQIPLPSFWGGYQVSPQAIEFWQGSHNRLHDRFEYRRQPDDSWTIVRLAP